MDIFDELKVRKVLNNITNIDKANEFVSSKKWGLYCGFDPSFKSLHLGNYLMLVTLKRFINAGYPTYAIIGGATGRIGDPSGKKNERKLLDIDTIKDNIKCINTQIKKIIGAKIIDNYEFYKGMDMLDFLRDVGKYFNVNSMLEKEIVSKRLEIGISFAEFSYTLIQSYDFYKLYVDYDVALQIGGSDQWGNITNGVDFIRKKTNDNNKSFGMTVNLLTKSDGTKFGKSESGAIYLDPKITSPYLMYQFLINQADTDVEKLLLTLTFISVDEIKEIIKKHNENKSLRYGQKILAKTIVSDIHGETEAEKCIKLSEMFFSGKIDELSNEDLLVVLNGMPKIDANEDQYNILDILVLLNVCESKSQARQLIQGKSIFINNKLIDNIDFIVNRADAIQNKFSYIKKGKKNYFLINWK
ncbi:MAG: tyrosine--tRNA ligase [Mycoplasma sp.]|nr:tyrosine--tRNA ligase [Mycoplasma sp.]